MGAEPKIDPIEEKQRLEALDRYDILDTPPEEAFDRITRLARLIFDVPISTVTLIDGHRQWFKSRQGIDAKETDLSQSLCQISVVRGKALIVEDTLAAPDIRDNPCVTGGSRIRFYAGIPLSTVEGHVIGTLCVADIKPRAFSQRDAEVLSDLAQFVISELELRTLASTDALTGVLSRRAFKDEADRAVALAKRHQSDLSVFMLDLDHFKRVNDTFGHHAGDRVLVDVVSALRECSRRSDVIGRLGGEEFVVLLHRCNADSAFEVAEKLRSAIAHLAIDIGDRTIGATISIGIATLDRSDASVDLLIERADAALYAAKADGRNRCMLWRPPLQTAATESRRRVLKGGRIAFNGGHSTIDCTVRSLSETGAGIDFVSTADVPERFKLLIMADGVSRACRVKARGDRRVEVDFA